MLMRSFAQIVLILSLSLSLSIFWTNRYLEQVHFGSDRNAFNVTVARSEHVLL